MRNDLSALLGFLAGVVITLAFPRKAKRRLTLHMRGTIPGYYSGRTCETCRGYAEFLDQDTRAWCGKHLPKSTVSAERAVSDLSNGGHANGECHVHGIECPKPWSYVYK